MDKLTDLEICKRIAEIENVKHQQDRGVIILSENYSDFINTICSGRYHPDQVKKITLDYSYNPLTDDALCFKLMVKYQVTFQKCPFYIGRFLTCIRDNDNGLAAPKRNDTNPNKAICMTIIEAHK